MLLGPGLELTKPTAPEHASVDRAFAEITVPEPPRRESGQGLLDGPPQLVEWIEKAAPLTKDATDAELELRRVMRDELGTAGPMEK